MAEPVRSASLAPLGRHRGTSRPVARAARVRALDHRPHSNKALVREAMTSLFQRHDTSAVDQLYATDYIQHNPDIPQGRDALRTLVAGLSKDVFYEPGIMVAERDFVAIHGRIRGWADRPRVVIDLFRIEDGKLAEHWDVLQDEVPAVSAHGGVSMFDPGEGPAEPSTIGKSVV